MSNEEIIEKLQCENTELKAKIESIESTKCDVSMDYERAYYGLSREYAILAKENEQMKEALIKIALRL